MTSALEISDRTDRMPAFWGRQVVFFANLYEIFYENHAKTAALAEVVGPSRSYGGRFIPALNLLYRGAQNLLVLEEAPSVALCRYFSEDLGLTLPEVLVMPADDYPRLASGEGSPAVRRLEAALQDHLQRTGGRENRWVDGFVTDAELVQIAGRLGLPVTTTPEGSRRGNNKLLIFEHLRDAGWPVIPSVLAESPGAVRGCLDTLGGAGFTHAVVKSQMGASGIGLRKLSIAGDREVTLPEYFFTEGPCLVQGWLQPGERGIVESRSPSVQFFLGEDGGTVFDITEQLLSGRILHEGNQSPPPYMGSMPRLREMLFEQAVASIRWLHAQGYRGFGGLDFLVVERGGSDGLEVFVSEINARVTAATYPSILVRSLCPGARWTLRNVNLHQGESEAEILDRLRRNDQLFRPGHPGIMPLNFSAAAGGLPGKAQFLGVGETGEALLERALFGG